VILKDLLRSSFRLIQEMQPGQTANVDDNADAIFVLNSWLDAMPVERLNVFTESIASYTLVPNQPSYTIGPSAANFTAPRPIRVDKASIIINPLSSLPIEQPLHIIREEAEWQEVIVKSLATSYPFSLYNDGQNPTSTLHLYPISTAANSLVLYTRQPFTPFAAITDTVVFPPGYADFLRYGLACKLAPEWGRVLRADVLEMARAARLVVQANNTSQETMKCDPAVTGRGRNGLADILRSTMFYP
jgi:hypothetical protein